MRAASRALGRDPCAIQCGPAPHPASRTPTADRPRRSSDATGECFSANPCTIRNDPEHPSIETPAHLGEMLIRLDEAELQDVFGDIRASRHAQGMTVERIAVPSDQRLERVAISAEHALDDELISVVLINCALISPQGWLRRLHDNRVTHFPRVGQGASPAVLP